MQCPIVSNPFNNNFQFIKHKNNKHLNKYNRMFGRKLKFDFFVLSKGKKAAHKKIVVKSVYHCCKAIDPWHGLSSCHRVRDFSLVVFLTISKVISVGMQHNLVKSRTTKIVNIIRFCPFVTGKICFMKVNALKWLS